MTVAEELIAHIRDTVVPDKKRILRTRYLASELARGVRDRAAAKTLVQKLNNAYLVLQLATLSDDPAMAKNCRGECMALVLSLDRARGAGQDADQDSELPSPA